MKNKILAGIISAFAAFTLVSCNGASKQEYPKEIKVNCGSIVLLNDSIAVIYNDTGFSGSESKVVNLKHVKMKEE